MKLVFGPYGQGGYARAIHHEACLTQGAIALHERYERESYVRNHGEPISPITIRNLGGRPKLRCANCRDYAAWIIEGVHARLESSVRSSWVVCDDCREWARNIHRDANALSIVETPVGDLDCWTCMKPIKDGDPYVAPVLTG